MKTLFCVLLAAGFGLGCNGDETTRKGNNSVRAIDPNGAVTDTESVHNDRVLSDSTQGLTH
jgi:hypothetical protein